MKQKKQSSDDKKPDKDEDTASPADPAEPVQTEIGGRGGKDPARYGDWEIDGKCVDF